jgi:hypothetical protein
VIFDSGIIAENKLGNHIKEHIICYLSFLFLLF